MKKVWLITLVVVIFAVALAGCSSGGSTAATSSSSSSSSSSSADGKALLEARCSGCNSMDHVTDHKGTAEQWKSVVDQMIQRGAQLTSAEEATLVDYLAATYK